MTTRIMGAALGTALCILANSASAQPTNMSDATGANIGLFSRGIVRAFGAPPAPPPVLLYTPAILDALCVERADALLTYATLSRTTETKAEWTALVLLRGGPDADVAMRELSDIFVAAGADATAVLKLLRATNGLLAPGRPEVINVADAVERFNEVVAGASQPFLANTPAEFVALRRALGRLTAAANHAFTAERVYPGLATAGIRYANGAPWLIAGEPIAIGGVEYFQYGGAIAVGNRTLKRIADVEGVWVLAEPPVAAVPAMVYVPLRTYCDIELLPFAAAEKVIKRQTLWP